LETCVGTNRNLKYYRPGAKVTMLDLSANMIEIAMTKTNPFIDVKYKIGDVCKMKFPDNTFDTVIDTFGLEYVN
jgi:methyltransferase OMS1